MKQVIHLQIRLRWWLRLYLQGVSLMACLMDAEPDMGKVERAIERGIVVRVVPVRFAIEA